MNIKETVQNEQDINSFVWKGHKEIDENGTYQQKEKRMVDMSEEELRSAYAHCKTMLFNKDTHNPGRYLVLELVSDQRDRCGAELFLRYAEQSKGTSRITLISAINEFMTNNKEVLNGIRPTLDLAFQKLPDEFKNIPLDLVLDGCLDRLGAFTKKHITRAFILRQGVWLTPAESKDLTEKDQFGNIINKLDVIRERLNIKDVERLAINSKGLNFTELRAMLTLKPNKKYRDLTTMQLETLRSRILFILEETVKRHIDAWEGRMVQLDKVAKIKNIKF